MINMRALVDGEHYFDRVAAFYRMFSGDVCYYGDNILIEPAKVTRVIYRSITDLLGVLRQFGHRGEKQFLIVSHGNPDGLPLRIVAANRATMNADFMDYLSDALAGRAAGRRNAMAYADDSGRAVFANEQRLDAFLDLVREVRQLQMEHLEFRGCNLGAGPALKAIHTLLGARLTAAPKVRFVWSQFPTVGIRGTPDWLRRQIDTLPPDKRLFNRVDCLRAGSEPARETENVLALAISGFDGQGRPTGLQILALNSDIIKGFTQSYLQPVVDFAIGQQPPGGGYRPGGLLPIIGFHTPQGMKPFVLPGDGFEYTDQIAYEMAPPTWVPP